jgi:tripartite-type tricarboxylate transporter receptor subunit TctC
MKKLLSALALGLLASAASAQAWPAKPVTQLEPIPPGGSTDTLARVIAQSMGSTLGRTVIVENKPGAGGNIAAQQVAKSDPSGNTLLMSFTSHTINATLFKKLPFDPVADFTPITMVAQVPSVLVARRNAPFNDVAGLIDYARKNPGKLTFAIGGQGSSLHLAAEQFKLATQTEIVNIPYKGTGPALTDLLSASTVDLMFASTINVLPHYRSATLKFLGVSSPRPLAQFDGLPAIAQTVPGYQSQAWFGLFGPAQMPKDVVDKLYAAVKVAMASPDFRKRMDSEAATVPTMTPAQFADFIRKDVDFWGDIVRKSGATVE